MSSGTSLPSRVGRLEVQAPLGVGGFAEVVRAHDPELASGVAIKVLSPRWATDPDARERFLAEARHLRRVRNPSVVAVFDIGELDDGRPYFVMELADRGPLDRRLDDPALPPVAADAEGIARLIDGLAEGLGAIHESGLVHRDLNPRNLLLRSAAPTAAAFGDRDESGEATTIGLSRVRDDERVVIADLGLAKDVAASPEVSVIGGSAGYQAPEQLLADGIVGPWSDVYATSALLYRVLTGERPPEPGRFDDVQQLVEPQWRPVLRRGLDPETSARFGSIAEFATAAFSALGVDRTASGRVERAPGGDRIDECPYRGLASYEPEHADSFFGRETTSAAAVEGLRHERVLAVLGASGSGKSSVVRAGLLPAIADGRLAGSESWPRILMTPGADPVGELRYQLRRVAESLELASVASSGDAATELRARADAIGDRAGGLLICVDQFEEVFTHDHGRQRDPFVEVLAAVVASPTSRVRLVIAMRADFYAEAARSPWLARVLTDNQLLVGPMEATQLRRAVIGPAEYAGLEVDERLVEAVLAEMGDDPGSLPLLGHAMAETWRRREGRRLTLDGFRGAGGVAGAIAQTAEHVFREQLGDEERVVARDLLLRMVTAGQGTPHTRRRLALTEIDAAGDPMAAAVIDQLVDARLVTVDESTAQIAHEALILEWPRLRQWIDDSVDDLRLRANLQRAAQDWVDHDQDPTLLFRGTPLIAARDLAARSAGQLGPTERQFLDAAIAAADREADLAAAARRRQRLGRVVMVGSLVALLVVAVIAWLGVQRTRADERSRAAEARLLDSLGLVARLTAGADPLLGLALGVEARSLTDGPNPDSWLALVQARQSLAAPGIVPIAAIDTDDELSLGVSADGRWATVGSRLGEIKLISLETREVVETIQAHDGGVQGLAFNDAGTALASIGNDQTLQVRSIDTDGFAMAPPLTIELGSLVWSVAWSPDGDRLATATEDGSVRLFDAVTGAQVLEPISDQVDMLRVAFSPDGAVLLAANGEGRVWGLAAADGSTVFGPVDAHDGDIRELRFSPDGASFVTSSSDATVRRFDTRTGDPVDELFRDVPGVAAGHVWVGAAFTPDGRQIVSGTDTGELVLWDLEQGEVVARESPPGELAVQGVGVSGTTLVTLARDQAVRIWRLGASGPLGVALGEGNPARSVALAPDRSFVATGSEAGVIRVHDPETGAVRAEVEISGSELRALAVSPDSALVAAGTGEGTVVLFDVADAATISVDAHPERINTLAFAPDGARLATGSRDGSVRIWALPSGEMLSEFGAYGADGVQALAWHPDGGELAIAGFDGNADVWGVDGRRRAGPVDVDGDALQAVAYSANGEQIAFGSGAETASIFRADLSVRVAGPLATLPGGVAGVAFLDDDALLLAVARDGTIRLWDIESGAPIGQPIDSDRGKVLDVSVLNDGPLFASASDGESWLWNLLDIRTACEIIDGVVPVEQPTYLGEGGELTACEGES